jgi:hypothetical protein
MDSVAGVHSSNIHSNKELSVNSQRLESLLCLLTIAINTHHKKMLGLVMKRPREAELMTDDN